MKAALTWTVNFLTTWPGGTAAALDASLHSAATLLTVLSTTADVILPHPANG